MPALSDLTNKLQYKSRMDSARNFVTEFRQQGAVPALFNLGTRFGRANRALIGGVAPAITH